MSRKFELLSAVKVNSLKKRGFYCDGGGLYLQVAPSGSKSWVFRYKRDGKARDMGLGGLHTVTLAEAREKATASRKLHLDRIDPLEARKAQDAEKAAAKARMVTFKEAAEQYIASHKSGWKSATHQRQWGNTLETYVYPFIGSVSVTQVDETMIRNTMQQHVPAMGNKPAGTLWVARAETAKRVRNRIKLVIKFAKEGLVRQVGKRGKQPSLPYQRIGEFVGELHQREGVSATCLEFLILTAIRTGSVLAAQWDQIDFAAKTWTVPAQHMKGGEEGDDDYVVPLAPRAIAILEAQRAATKSQFIFPNDSGRPLSDDALNTTIKRMNKERGKQGLPLYVDPKQKGRAAVPHGFRATFSTWRADKTAFQKEVAEAALAHTIKDKVEGAYNRGELLEKRRKLMAAWAGYCAAPAAPGKVIPINRAAG
jgi:integrase